MPAVWRAHANGNRYAPAHDSPRAAALAFFAKYPTARKCSVLEYSRGENGSLRMVIDLTGTAPPRRDFRDVSAKAAASLPEA